MMNITPGAPLQVASFRPIAYRPAPHRQALRGPESTTPVGTSPVSTGMSTSPSPLALGAVMAVTTAISGALGYYGIKAGLEEKGFLAVLGWLVGVPATLSAGVGLLAIAGLAVESARTQAPENSAVQA